LSHNVNFNHVLHERILLVAIEMMDTPRVEDGDRATVTDLCNGMTRIQLHFGFMEKPDVPQGLLTAVAHHVIAPCNLQQITYFAGHETVIPTSRKNGMARWRKSLFVLMHHNAQQPAAFFNIPSAQVMEIGVEFVI
jgi:KUP system potassium uptake protein